MKKIDPNNTDLKFLHHIILGSVAPRPIAFASTIDKNGNPNLSPFSYFNAFGVNPVTLIFSPARRGRDKTMKHTYENIKEVPEVVINVVNYDIVEQMSLSSTEYDKGVNEFIKSGLTPLKSDTVKPFRVKESPVQYECVVKQVIETSENGGAGNLVICEAKMIHVNEDIFTEEGRIHPDMIRLIGRHVDNYYVKAFGESLFEVEKPLAKKGIGVDALPDHIRLSKVISGNDLGKLGNVEKLPTFEEVAAIKKLPEVEKIFRNFSENQILLQENLQILAKHFLSENKVKEALAILLV
jgi:flavin reductase (DIM6/NTAB) family NADH-FMN oxidoreductase RutF